MLDSNRDWVGKLTREHANPMAGFARGKGERRELAAAHGGAAAPANRCGQNRAREREKNKDPLLHYLDAKLRGGEIVDEEQRNGGVAWSSKLQQWRRAEAKVLRGQNRRLRV